MATGTRVTEIQRRLAQCISGPELFTVATPPGARSPREGSPTNRFTDLPPSPRSHAGASYLRKRVFGGPYASARAAVETLLSPSVGWSPHRVYLMSGVALAAAFLVALLAPATAYWALGKGEATEAGGAARGRQESFDDVFGKRLSNIAASVGALRGLNEVVATADQTYEQVYHEELVQHDLDARHPDEVAWNSFVLEARRTGPVFLEGKEALRDASASLHRLIRRAPEHFKHMMIHLRERDADEACWYFGKAASLVESVHSGMEKAVNNFVQVDAAMDGMARDARENEEHLGSKAERLQGEAEELEVGSLKLRGRWAQHPSMSLWGCQLEKAKTSLAECRTKCITHGSAACVHVTYYKMANRNNCYLHCASATQYPYPDADTHVLERGPEELAVDLSAMRRAGTAAVTLAGRWQTVQRPLREVTRLVKRFRGATSDLRKSLEEVRYATNDLRATLAKPEAESQLRVTERRVGDVLAAIEDLGYALSAAR